MKNRNHNDTHSWLTSKSCRDKLRSFVFAGSPVLLVKLIMTTNYLKSLPDHNRKTLCSVGFLEICLKCSEKIEKVKAKYEKCEKKFVFLRKNIDFFEEKVVK